MNKRLLQTIVGALVVVTTSFLVFVGTVNHGYLNWDDNIYVRDNDMIRSLSPTNVWWWFSNPYYYSYIPLTMLSHAVDYSIWQDSPRGHHLTNVILHSLNAGWVVLLGLAFMQRVGVSRYSGTGGLEMSKRWSAMLFGAIAGALFYALHPLRAESVSWISDRKDLLCTFFLLPATVLYLRYSRLRGQSGAMAALWLSFLLFLFAALSKAIAVTFPVILFLIDWLLDSKQGFSGWTRTRLMEKVPFVIVSVILGVVALAISPDGKVAYSVGQLEGVDVILFPFYSFGFYIWKTLLPVNLSPIYPSVQTGIMILGLGFFVVITAGFVYSAVKGKREFLVGWLVYLSLLVPTVVGLSSGMQPQADRFSYLATIPLFLLLGGGFSATWRLCSPAKKVILALAGAALLTASIAHTLRMAKHWESSSNLWTYVVDSFPPTRDYLDAYINLGEDYAASWELPEAEDVLKKAIEIDSTSTDAFYNLALVLYLRGDWEGAAGLFKKSTDLDSTNANGFFDYAVVSSQLGRDDLAVPAMRRAAALGMQEATDALENAGISPEPDGETTIPLERK